MATKITSRVIAPGAVTAEALAPGVGAGPVIANVQIANSSYVALDDTAVALSGGYILINGENFGQNTQVIIANTNATSVTYISSSLVRAQVPAKSAGSYILYLVNTDTGATAIRVNAVTYSGTPTWSTGSSLDDGAVNEAISIQLSATADSNVLYQLQAGSTLPSGLTLAANGLLSGTVTGINEDTLYNFTIEAVDAENQDSPRAFSITITAGDQYINSVILALNADTNTFITDSSTNSFAITPNGDTRPSAFSPYNTSWSNFFDGTGDYLRYALNTSSEFSLGTSDFTDEVWVFPTAFNAGSTIISAQTQSSGTAGNGYSLYLNGSGQPGVLVAASSGAYVVSLLGTALPLNTWTHLAVTRNGNTFTLWRNGVSNGTATSSATITQDTSSGFGGWNIGASPQTGQFHGGYISNYRLVKGTAVYTSNFTPPTTPLTAISGTSLLTCQSNRLIDNSTNNFTITRNGDVKVTSFAPFTETDTTTGSGYFDGAGDYLVVPDNASLESFTDFTIECWVWFNSVSGTQIVVDKGWNGSTAAPYLIFLSSGNLVAYATAASTWDVLSATSFGTMIVNQWYHIALTRSGSSIRLFTNGNLVNTVTNSSTLMNSASGLGIGGGPSAGANPLNGYISNLRIIKGTAVYTSAFTPPTSPLTAITNTSLLTLQNRISYNNSQPVDESGVKNIVTRVGNASVGSYTPHTPAGWSAYFDGTGDYLEIADNNALDLSGDFTIELWFYWVKRTGATFPRLMAKGDFQAAASAWRIDLVEADGYCGFAYGSTDVSTSFGTQTPNQWTHLAVTRSGSTLRTFRNGILQNTRNSVTQDFTSTYVLRIGAANALNVNELFSGNISNARIIKGTALYTSTFTPPTTPLEPVTNTSLLTLRGPGFTDDGPNRFAITRNGDTIITPFSPFKTHTIVPDSHSVYFDGTGDYLTVPDSVDTEFGSGNFTIELWFYANQITAGTQLLGKDWWTPFYFEGSNLVTYLSSNGSTWDIASNQVIITSPSPRTWYHVAMVRNGTSIRAYVNGALALSLTSSAALYDGNYPITIARRGTTDFNGYISNIRIVKGTALYTSAFTPSTTPLTNIANTSLLTCQSSTAIDNSNNAFSITVNGNAQPTKFNPFGETITTGVQYSPASHGGSYYFDGTGDSVSLTPFRNADFVDPFNTGRLSTVECWLYLNVLTSPRSHLFGHWASNVGWTVDVDTSGNLFFTSASAGTTVTLSSKIQIRQWQHLALSFNGTTTAVYLNGINVGSIGVQNPNDATTNFVIGCRSDNVLPTNGYISNLVFYNGYTKYTSNFVPPEFIQYDPRAIVMLNGTNAAIADGVGKNVLETIGTARQVSDTKKYGTGSIHIPATTAGFKTDGVDLPGDFTIEFWVLSPITGGERFLIIQGINVTNGFLISATQNAIRWRSNGQTDIQYVFPTNNTNWYHVAVVRSGSASNNVKVYYDGNSVVSGTYTNQILASAGSLHIGPSNLLSASFAGYGHIDDLRITKGIARYTSNFTPPTSSFKLK